MCLFHFCTCFEQPSVHHQENQLYQYIIWYISLCVCGRLVCRSETFIPDGHLHRLKYTRWCIDTIDSPDDEHWVVRNMYRSGINTLEKCVKVVINTNYFLKVYDGFNFDQTWVLTFPQCNMYQWSYDLNLNAV